MFCSPVNITQIDHVVAMHQTNHTCSKYRHKDKITIMCVLCFFCTTIESMQDKPIVGGDESLSARKKLMILDKLWHMINKASAGAERLFRRDSWIIEKDLISYTNRTQARAINLYSLCFRHSSHHVVFQHTMTSIIYIVTSMTLL
jgi:hypothetical protein